MNIADLQTAKIDQLAAEYRAKGYDVHVHPDRAHLPKFLTDFSPDVVALSPADNVLIEVTSTRDFDGEEIQKVAELVEKHRPWRLQVAFVNLPAAPDVPSDEDLAADEQIGRLIANAELLAKQHQTEAAALLAWSAIEAILRTRARSAAPELERQSSARVLTHLYSLGLIQPDVYETLLRLMEFRNAVAHGFAPKADAPDLSEVIADIRRLRTAA